MGVSWMRMNCGQTRCFIKNIAGTLQNKAEFVQLLLYNNLKLEDHFKEEDLYNLYNEANLLEKKKNKDEWFKMIDK